MKETQQRFCWVSYLDTNLLKSIESGCFVEHNQHTDDIEIVFKGARGASYKLRINRLKNKT